MVWLTSEPDPVAEEHGLAGSALDKTAVRFTVDVPDEDVHRWIEWSRKRGITKAWANALERNASAESWYVVERRIPGGRVGERRSISAVSRRPKCLNHRRR